MQTNLFDYDLPKELIAQKPVFPRDHSRLMILDRTRKAITHSFFYNLPLFLNPSDVLVFNQTKVIPARLIGKKENGVKLELLLLKRSSDETWEVLTKPGLKQNQKCYFDADLEGIILSVQPDGNRIIKFNQSGLSFDKTLHQIGIMPTPPYIKTKLKNPAWYQTVFAKNEGSAAAPTAGFHFTEKLLRKLDQKGIQKEFITLHVGLDTFRPVRTEKLEDHEIHSEWCEVDEKTAGRLNEYKKEGRRIIAVGTTTVRTLESAASVILRSPAVRDDVRIPLECAISVMLNSVQHPFEIPKQVRDDEKKPKSPIIKPFSDSTRLFIYPPYQFKFVDAVITNFHLPQSTLLALVSAFAGREFILEAYQKAIEKKYRFFSFGDGMLIV